MNRRKFLQSSLGSLGTFGALGSLGSSGLVSRLRAGFEHSVSTTDDILVVVQVPGGLDMLSLWVPYGLPAYATRRGALAYAAPDDLTAPIERRCLAAEPSLGIGFGPAMGELQRLYQRGDVAVVQRVGYPSPSRSHFTSQQIWRYGQRDLDLALQDPRGWLARFADDDIALPAAVIGINTPGFLEFQSRDGRVVLVDSLDTLVASEDNRELRLLQRAMDRIATEPSAPAEPVREVAARAAVLRADLEARLGAYDPSVVYPATPFAASMREAARLVVAGGSTRAVFVTRSGPSVDTHSDQVNRLASIRAELDAALGAFVSDLEQNAVWNRVTVVVYTEFGRTLDANGSLGTDHGEGNHVFVLGDAVVGGPKGQPVSATDLAAGRFLPGSIDFREILHEIALQRLQIDLDQHAFVESYARTPGGLGLF